MQYKINQAIIVRYLAENNESGIIDLYLTPTNPSGADQTPILMSEIGAGLYTASFTPTTVGWWLARVSSSSKPQNVYSKSYFVGTDYIDNKIGEIQETPTSYTLLGRLKDIWDKINGLFSDGLAKVKLWDGMNIAGINSQGRLKVDIAQTDYIAKSVSEIVDILIPINTDYWILNLNLKEGIIDEIHIITDSDKFLFKIEINGFNYLDEMGADLKLQYLLDTGNGVSAKNIETISGKDFHCNLPLYFNTSIKIGIRNNLENNKKLKGYIILYRERII